MEEKNISTEADGEGKIYEIGYHIVPSVPEDKLGAEVSTLKDVLEQNGAVVISEGSPKMRALSYEMRKEFAGKYKKYVTAYFGFFKFEARPENALLISDAFKKKPSILRYLLIRTVRENTMSVPHIPAYRKAPVFNDANKPVSPEGGEVKEKADVFDAELNKAIDAAIAE